MNIVKKTKKTKILEDFRPGEACQSLIGGDLYMRVADADAVAINLTSGELCYFDYDDEFIPVNCAIVMEE